jgi:hypothetical protein
MFLSAPAWRSRRKGENTPVSRDEHSRNRLDQVLLAGTNDTETMSLLCCVNFVWTRWLPRGFVPTGVDSSVIANDAGTPLVPWVGVWPRAVIELSQIDIILSLIRWP